MTIASKIRWAARKVFLPVNSGSYVLEVGSGGNPHPYADVLLEKYLDNSHRLKSIKIDRHAVIADACHMPFADEAFDYVLCYHVLEHVKTPALFMDELSRVGRAGYLETPNAVYERLTPFDVHVLQVALIDNKISIEKKTGDSFNDILTRMHLIDDNNLWKKIFDAHPEAFHVCHKWVGQIEYEIFNDDISLDWFIDPPAGIPLEQSLQTDVEDLDVRVKIRERFLAAARYLHKLRHKSKPSFESVLACPISKMPVSIKEDFQEVRCEPSGLYYPIVDGVPVMLPESAQKIKTAT